MPYTVTLFTDPWSVFAMVCHAARTEQYLAWFDYQKKVDFKNKYRYILKLLENRFL